MADARKLNELRDRIETAQELLAQIRASENTVVKLISDLWEEYHKEEDKPNGSEL